jgi:hypothetical protein
MLVYARYMQHKPGLGSRRACSYSETGFSNQNGNVLDDYTTEEQRSVVRFFLWTKGHNAKGIYNAIFYVYGEKCLSRKAVHNCVEKFSQGRLKVADDETDVRKWQTEVKIFLCCSF